jgi:hypothetical protein
MNTNIFFSNLNKPHFFYNNILKKHIFFFIAQKIVDKESNRLTINIKKQIIISFITTNKYSIKRKFELITETEQNIFYNKAIVNDLLLFLCKIQKAYFGFIKFKNICLLKKTQTQVDYDICLNPIDKTKQTCICIYQNNRLYWFLIRDLMNIINTALTNAPGFFSEPLISKNPYNNMPFNKSTLYNIYFKLKYSGLKMPDLIDKFFLTNFDLGKFAFNHEHLVREYAIEKYIKNTPESNLYQSTIIMLQNYNLRINPIYIINVHPEFPKERLVKILKPCLILYFEYSYSLIKTVKLNALNCLFKKLKQLKVFNPRFGRKIISMGNPSYFDDKHMNFNNENIDEFLYSHANKYYLLNNLEPYDNYDTNENDDNDSNNDNEEIDEEIDEEIIYHAIVDDDDSYS